jgi:hypothetical protein
LCCRLLPVEGLNKGANVRCEHVRAFKGCSIYHKSGFPFECGGWTCVWKATDQPLPRPDRAHYVIDIVMDKITLNNDSGEATILPVVQVWVDPDFPKAHKDPSLRDWLERVNLAAIIRYNSKDAMILFPPKLNTDGVWIEFTGSKLQIGPTRSAPVYRAIW